MDTPRATTPPNGAWKEWMRGLGRQVRRAREFLGLTQDELGERARVSQGAISRLEAGRGLATPLIVVVKIAGALQQALANVDQTLLSPETRRLVKDGLCLVPPDGAGGEPAAPLTSDPSLVDYVQIYHRVPERRRKTFLAVVRATSDAVRHDQADDDKLASAPNGSDDR